MSHYSMDERETHFSYNPLEDYWLVYSTHRPHIRQLLERAEITDKETDERGRVVSVSGKVERNQIRIFKQRG